MISVVMRAASSAFDVESFTRRFPEVKPDATWKKGERRLRSRPPSEDSGFNMAIGGGNSWEVAWGWTRKSLRSLESAIEELLELGVRPSLDIGVVLEGPGYEIVQASLSPEDLQYLLRFGFDVLVTVYPTDEGKFDGM